MFQSAVERWRLCLDIQEGEHISLILSSMRILMNLYYFWIKSKAKIYTYFKNTLYSMYSYRWRKKQVLNLYSFIVKLILIQRKYSQSLIL